MDRLTDERLKAAEERKREAAWSAAERWRVLQDTIAWAERQATVRRNTPQQCMLLQSAKLHDRDLTGDGRDTRRA